MENARWNDASLLPERGLTLSPAVDANLRDRVRSLLVSRNRRNPPKTPCPSPDHNLVHENPEQSRPDSSSGVTGLTGPYKINPTQTAARLSQLENRSLDMGAVRFDGPAGQIGESSGDAHARRPSQPDQQMTRKTSNDWLLSNAEPRLNRRAYGDILGREAFPLDRKNSLASKKSTGSRIPRFHLRTVPPAKDVNKILRPQPLHVPGSYRSEIDSKKDHELKTLSPPLEDTLKASDNGILAVLYHSETSNDHSHQAAVNALKDAARHDHSQASLFVSNIHGAASHETSKPQAVMTEGHDNPLEVSPNQDVSEQAERPTLSHAEDIQEAEDEGAHAPLFVIGDDHEKGREASHGIALLDDHSSKEAAPKSGGPQISDLLAELPPLRPVTLKDIVSDDSAATKTVELGKVRSRRQSSSVSSLHSIALDQHEGVSRPISPVLSEARENAALAETAEEHDDATVPLVPDTRRSSQVTTRFSVSRAMSILSEMGARSGIKTPSLRSSTKYKKLDSGPTLTARPKRRSKRGETEELPATVEDEALIKHDRLNSSGTPNKDPDLVVRSGENHGEGFTRVISDLESVLNEALSIAGKADHQNHSRDRQLSIQNQRGNHGRADFDVSSSSSECLSSLSGEADEEDNYTTLPPQGFSDGHVSVPRNELGNGGDEARETTSFQMQAKYAKPATDTNDTGPKSNHQISNGKFLEIPRTSSRASKADRTPLYSQSSNSTDWNVSRLPSQPSKLRLELKPPPPAPQMPLTVQAPAKEQHTFLIRDHGNSTSEDTVTRIQIRDYVNAHQRPPVQPRLSSRRLRAKANPGRIPKPEELNLPNEREDDDQGSNCECVPYVADFETPALQYHPAFRNAAGGEHSQNPKQGPQSFRHPQDNNTTIRDGGLLREEAPRHGEAPPATNTYSLEGRHHFSIREPRGFSLSRSHRRSPIARDWSSSRKRFTAVVACITTAFMGLIIGIYAGEVPAIQYAIADEHHYAILGNVFFFIGLAITTALFYPLPLLHGRKPYTLAALAILLPLFFPQALAINQDRSPYVATYRVGLLVPRVFAGIAMGFANINFITTLLDLFGSSLQSGNPHQETVNENDVRRHGGGMGLWLGIWTWCAIGSLGLGFLIGAGIISGLDVSWGFWILIILNAAVLLLNIITPEVRRSAYRRSMAEVRSGGDVSRRVARGEIKMHLEATGPVWWWEEVIAGHVLAIRMLLQPGFAVLALYQGWIYGQMVLIIVVSPVSLGLALPSSRSASYSGHCYPGIISFNLSTWVWLLPLFLWALC